MPFHVPTVDVSPYVARGSVRERAATATALDEACREVGFVQVVGHAVPDHVVEGLTAAIDDFFALPETVKAEVQVDPALNRGWTPPRTESQSLSLGVQPASMMNDFFEAFTVGRSLADHPDVAGLVDHAGHYADSVWPAGCVGFRERVETYLGHAERVAGILVEVAEDALGLERGWLQARCDHPIAALRLISYALDEGTEVALDGDLRGMGEHTDFGFLTVLWADRVPGLQVLGRDGAWHDVQPAEGALLVNLGDLTARLTNDRWSSTLHRVVPPVVDGTVLRRRSAAYFHDGDADAVVAPLPAFVDEQHPARYAEVSVDAHVRAKLAGSGQGVLNDAAGSERERVLQARATTPMTSRSTTP